jgi:acyl-CoA synthetase (AMP-forming)/AMP-acid ligase II
VPGDRVATLAWNNFRHFEIEHGVTGLGAVWHAINPRLISSQEDDWFNTGDLAVMDGNNYIQLTDRAKDVIKSGGEWISSIDVENLAAGCPGVAEAAVIGSASEVGGTAVAGARARRRRDGDGSLDRRAS